MPKYTPTIDEDIKKLNEKHLAEVPSCQTWLDNNPAAKASLELGLQQASQGRGRYLGSFAHFNRRSILVRVRTI